MTRPVIPFPLRTASPDPERARAQAAAIERAIIWRMRIWRARRNLREHWLELLLVIATALVTLGTFHP